MLPDFKVELESAIAYYERFVLAQRQPLLIDPVSLLDGHSFVRVRGLANFWQGDNQVNFWQHVVDLVTGTHSYESYLTFVLTGTPHQIDVYFSVSDVNTTRNLLYGAYPGVSLQKNVIHKLGSKLKARFAHAGMISGIPSPKHRMDGQTNQAALLQLERVVRGMRDATWVYVVQAFPRPRTDVAVARQELLDKIARIASMSRQQVQRSTQATSSRTKQQTETVSEMMGGEIVNRRAEYAVELMEQELARLEMALAMGRWQTAVYFGATQSQITHRLAALLSGVLSGPDSRPEPIRAHFCQARTGAKPTDFQTYLTSEEVAWLLHLPREEYPGYALSDIARFDVDYQPASGAKLSIGDIQWDGNDIGKPYQIAINHLARHGVVFGVTGSGKTTTLLHLLYQMWQTDRAKPFLIIEPAKTEYRALLGRVKNGSAMGPIPELHVYTLGNDTVAPFRLNPFEFETGDAFEAVAVLSHIDFLKAVFNAAFILYAPMPYVLETALHEIYEDKGWNLATGMNVRLTESTWRQRHRYPIFPTLTDLYHKVEAVTSRLGYEARIEQDVIAGLKARLGSLRLGAKGLMLDTPRGIPIAELLAHPTVLELENIGNDDEKTFLMGLLLARLYGHRRLQAAEGKLPDGLQHVLVIEEAHRLLKHVSTQVDTESSNLRAQAIETFVNMLAEVRHYGQGVLVAEQIPAKLTPDVVKNTNLKLIHRLLAQDDRELVGSAMNMDEAQMRHLTVLQSGEAVAYAEGDDHPFLIKMADFKKQHRLVMPVDRDLVALAESYITLDRYLPTPDFEKYGVRGLRFGSPDKVVYQAALQYLSRPDSRQLWARLIARTIFAREFLPDALAHLRQQIASHPGHLSVAQYNDALITLVVLGVAQALQERGSDQLWSYEAIEGMRSPLTEGLIRLVRTGDLKGSAAALDRFTRTYETSMKRAWGPYPGCHACRAICFYRTEVTRLLSPLDRGDIRSVLSSPGFKTQKDKYVQLSKRLQSIVNQWLGGSGTEVKDISYCAGLVAVPAIGLDEYAQADFGRELAECLLT